MRILRAWRRGGTTLSSATKGEAGALGRDLWGCLFRVKGSPRGVSNEDGT